MEKIQAILKALMWIVVGGAFVCIGIFIAVIRALLKGDWER